MKKYKNKIYVLSMALVVVFGGVSLSAAESPYPERELVFRRSLLSQVYGGFTNFFNFLGIFKGGIKTEPSTADQKSHEKPGGEGAPPANEPPTGSCGSNNGGGCANCKDGFELEDGNCVVSTGGTCCEPNSSITISSCDPGEENVCKCLSSSSKIATPIGEVAVTSLKVGDIVWTTDAAGKRVVRSLLKASHISAPNHRVVHLVLADGRTLDVSAPHPTGDGRTVGDLKVGDAYDGSIVQSAVLEPYKGSVTYDILPAGDTGYYWANGILMGSTLK